MDLGQDRKKEKEKNLVRRYIRMTRRVLVYLI